MDLKKHNYLLELLVIFIGLSLAFTLDRVWDNYKQSEAEEDYLNGFYKDISVDSEDHDEDITELKERVARLKKIIKDFDNNNVPNDSLFVVAQIMARQSKFVPQKITYETLKASGTLDVITNFKLRTKLAALYAKYDSYIFVEDAFNIFVNDHVFPFLYKNFDFLGGRVVTKNLSGNHIFKNLTVFFYSYFKAKYETLVEVKDLTDDVLKELKKELRIN